MTSIEWLVGLIYILGTLIYVLSEPTPEQQCPLPTNPAIKFSLNSRRNGTGYWISQFDFENGEENENPVNVDKSSPWSVAVEQNALACGENTLALYSRITVAVPDMVTPKKLIPAGYELFPRVGYYKFHSEAQGWARARQVCAEEGSHLIIINSEYEANVLKQIFATFPKEKITNSPQWHEWTWVGMYELGANGQYFTVLDEPWNKTEYSRWHPGQPNDPGTDDCMLASTLNGALNDHPCGNWKTAFICEL